MPLGKLSSRPSTRRSNTAAALGIAYYVRRCRLSLSYLDAIAVGLPLGVAVGRIGDVNALV